MEQVYRPAEIVERLLWSVAETASETDIQTG
jgi:hypothetical protein